MAAVASPSRYMTSQAPRCWLDFQFQTNFHLVEQTLSSIREVLVSSGLC